MPHVTAGPDRLLVSQPVAVEEGETPEAAGLREVAEEAGSALAASLGPLEVLLEVINNGEPITFFYTTTRQAEVPIAYWGEWNVLERIMDKLRS